MSCSLLEALQFGVTVIDRSNSGNKELITHNFNGFIYESPSEFKAQLEVLINEPQLRETFIRNGKLIFNERYSGETEMQQYKCMIERSIKEKQMEVRYGQKLIRIHNEPHVHNTSEVNNQLFLQLEPQIGSTAKVLDIGCGTAIFSLIYLMKSSVSRAELHLVDINTDILGNALFNCRQSSMQANLKIITICEDDFFHKMDKDVQFDIILFNPPQTPFQDPRNRLDKNGGVDGIKFYEAVLQYLSESPNRELYMLHSYLAWPAKLKELIDYHSLQCVWKSDRRVHKITIEQYDKMEPNLSAYIMKHWQEGRADISREQNTLAIPAEIFNLYCSPQSEIIGKLHDECHLHDPYIHIETLAQFNYSNNRSSYLYNGKQNRLYFLNNTEFVLQPLDPSKQEVKSYGFQNNCSKDMVFEYSHQKIFVFSCEAIFEVPTSGHTLAITQIMKNEQIVEISSARRFQDLIIVLTYSQGVFIYAVDVTLHLQYLLKLHQSGNQIVDAYYADHQLILLDSNKGLLFYDRQENNFTYRDSLSLTLEQEIVYYSMKIWKNTTFIEVEAETESFVVELQQINQKLYLARYYKGYDEIIKIEVVNESLVIHSNSKIDVFPFNRDPRTIKQLHNGYSYFHDQSLLSFQFLEQDRFFVLRAHSTMITKWVLKSKKIECEFPETGTYSIMVEQPCFPNTEKSFNASCLKVQRSKITVYHKDTYIWLLLICIGVFIAAVLCLISWRENKVARILFILRQIKGFQLKRKEIEFKEVQLQPTDAKQREWNELSLQKHEEDIDPYEQYASERNNLN